MGMVYCRGCGKEIHESAPTCPHCGAPQLTSASQQFSALIDSMKSGSSEEFMQFCLQPIKKYADFRGRARRKEYWYFVAAYTAAILLLSFVGLILGGRIHAVTDTLVGLIILGFLLPNIAVGVRRMHDTDRSGWWLFLPIGGLIFCCLDGQRGANRFGDDPKGS